MEKMKLYLRPGESIRTPRICMLFWQGNDPMAGNNRFRRFMLAHHTRTIDGKFAEYPLSAGFDWGDPAPCNEYGCLTEEFAVALINRYKQFGIVPEVFWLDAGWYEGSGGPDFSGGNWSTCVGNWIIDSTRFPRGLKPLSDAAHRVGAKFMVWFEPERAIVNSWLAKTHPEWMLSSSDKNPVQLFDLGNAEACAWLSKYIGDLLEQNGIDYYRQDFNMGISPYWEANDEPGRTGMKEIRHVEGLYKFWDYLLDRFPRLMIDNCESGGRRIDIEMMKISAPLLRTEYPVNGKESTTEAIRSQNAYLNYWVPISATGSSTEGMDDSYEFRSVMANGMTIGWSWSNSNWINTMLEQYQRCRALMDGDYYMLANPEDYKTANSSIMYYKPETGEGYLLAFRPRQSDESTMTLALKGLDPDAEYTVENADTGEVVTGSGKILMENGLVLTMERARASMLSFSTKN